jgi:phosphate transport system substrate-binding protein
MVNKIAAHKKSSSISNKKLYYMKKNVIIVIMLLTGSLVSAQTQQGIVKLRGTRLTYPLVNKWIEEFSKEYPGIKVTIAPNAPADSIDFNIAAYGLTDKDYQGNKEGVAIARYVQLPVANSKRGDLASLQEKGFTEKDFNNLYFTPGTPDLFASSQAKSPITLYTREKPACAAHTFAKHYGNDAATLQGTGVKGDDKDLANAVRNDVNGISFNNLGFVYDIKTRKVSEGLAVIPLDLNENGKVDKDEKVYTTLDEVIGYIERTNNPKFVTERVNFVFSKNSANKSAGIFLLWVLSKGQQFNHGVGFLGLDEKTLTAQKDISSSVFKVTSIQSCEGASDLSQQRKAKLASNK